MIEHLPILKQDRERLITCFQKKVEIKKKLMRDKMIFERKKLAIKQVKMEVI